MGDIVLFSPFVFVSASCCFSVSHDARITGSASYVLILGRRLSFRTAICSEQTSTDDKPRAIASLLGIAEVRRRKTKVKIT
ncbi:MAG: hypothetical protein KBT06_09640 [Prevotellaceae bacterium]|nr:hypothetical protein [Candidatus Colivivens equi]